MEQYDLTESEYRFASVIWEHEPLGSGKLVSLCATKLGWKKSTTYTVLKKLCEKGIFRNENAVITSVVGRDRVQRRESEQFVERVFGGSLPGFLNAFISEKGLTQDEVDELRGIIEKSVKNDTE